MNLLLKNILLLGVVAAYFYFGVLWERHSELIPYLNSYGRKDPVKKMTNFINHLSVHYVDDINLDTLVEKVIINTLSELDPHTQYIPHRNKQRLKEEFQGSYVGIGVNFYIESDTVTVIRVVENSPSEKSGILAGDRILMVNSDTLYDKNITNKGVTQKIKGKLNTTVRLKIYRRSLDSVLTFDIKRKEIPIKSVTAFYMLTEKTGYIKLSGFIKTSYEEFKNALDTLQAQKMEQLILDLRDNPGGYTHIARAIIDEFLAEGKIIMLTENNKNKIIKNKATSKGVFENQPLVILVNEQSASASELLAGAIQDNDRGYIIGTRTFGKGLVQQQINIGYGDAILLTTARYYTPSGRFIQKPYKNKSIEAYQSSAIKKDTDIHNGEADTLKYKTLKGRLVYGSGGIEPDITIKKDAKKMMWHSLVLSNFINYFVFKLVDKNRGDYVFENADAFISSPIKNSALIIEAFEKYCRESGVDYEMENLEKEAFLNVVKSYIGLQLFNEEVQLKIVNNSDPFIKRAVEKINSVPFVVE